MLLPLSLSAGAHMCSRPRPPVASDGPSILESLEGPGGPPGELWSPASHAVGDQLQPSKHEGLQAPLGQLS